MSDIATQIHLSYPALASDMAQRLEGTSDDVSMLCEDHEKFHGLDDDLIFLKQLDGLVFMCCTCNYWHRQRENATPDGSEWECKECHGE